MSVREITKKLKVPMSSVVSIIKRYNVTGVVSGKRGRAEKKLPDEVVKWFTSDQFLQKYCFLSLVARVAMINRKFNCGISRWKLTQIYRDHNIRCLKPQITKVRAFHNAGELSI